MASHLDLQLSGGFKGRNAIKGASDPQKRKAFIKGALPERSLAGGFTFFDGNEWTYQRQSIDKCCKYTYKQRNLTTQAITLIFVLLFIVDLGFYIL